MADRIEKAYGETKDIYDDLLTKGSLLGRMYIGVFWGGIDVSVLAEKLLSRIPEGFSGRILDVPVGTAVFTESKWRSLTDADIVCLDYSGEMLSKARERLGDVSNITFVQGDVGDLRMEDSSFDIVLSMNGFHAFPDKGKAFSETFRVLKEGGMFVSCFYIEGESRVTDWFVRNVLSRKGWFTPPFDDMDGLRDRLGAMYRDVETGREGSIVYITAIK